MNPGSMLILVLAILSEVVGTVALKASEGFARLGPIALVVVGYGLSFYFLALALKQMPLAKPDLLVSDIEMADEDGYSLIRRVRALEEKNRGLCHIARVQLFLFAARSAFSHSYQRDPTPQPPTFGSEQ